MPDWLAAWPFITDPRFYVVAVPAVLLMGLGKSGFLSGFGALATPLLALVVPVPQAAAIMLPLLLVMDARRACSSCGANATAHCCAC